MPPPQTQPPPPHGCTHARPAVARGRALPLAAEVDLGACLEAPYDDRAAAQLRNVHLGQRKLLLSEVQLLTEHYRGRAPKHPLLVYVGAAPGTHLLFLLELFPHVRFVLYDGAPFDPALARHPSGAFDVRGAFFTDATCKQVLQRSLEDKRPVVFVSDIRSDGRDAASFEQQVMWDLMSQRRWVELLRPALSLLKFRLPFTLHPGDAVPYLRGRLLFGIWPPRASAETRLLVRRADIDRADATYDYEAYERTLFFHNRFTRTACFADALPPALAALLLHQAPPAAAAAAAAAAARDEKQTAPPSTPSKAKNAAEEPPAQPPAQPNAAAHLQPPAAHGVVAAAAGAGEGELPAYCGCYDCASELMVYQRYVAVAAAAGRADLAADVASVARAYVRHARRHGQRLPGAAAPPRASASASAALPSVDAAAAAGVRECRARVAAKKIGAAAAAAGAPTAKATATT
jgi:hypothetical protein